MEIEEQIAAMSRKINKQIKQLGMLRKRQAENIWITEDGRIKEIFNHMDLDNMADDNKKRLDDMLRQLDELLKERDGV